MADVIDCDAHRNRLTKDIATLNFECKKNRNFLKCRFKQVLKKPQSEAIFGGNLLLEIVVRKGCLWEVVQLFFEARNLPVF